MPEISNKVVPFNEKVKVLNANTQSSVAFIDEGIGTDPLSVREDH